MSIITVLWCVGILFLLFAIGTAEVPQGNFGSIIKRAASNSLVAICFLLFLSACIVF